MPNARRLLVLAVLVASCSAPTLQGAETGVDAARDAGDAATALDAPTADDAPDATIDAVSADASDAARPPPACTTRIHYGGEWIHGPGHADPFDDAPGVVTWDGSCTDDASGNGTATLSNGWTPVFAGHSACTMDLEYSAGCTGVPTACTTRVTYGPAWVRPAGHAAPYDDADGLVLWSGTCAGATATLSNGWTPAFSSPAGCAMSLRYEQCGALYRNAVVAAQCPDPGVLRDGTQYVMACTSGNDANAYPIRTSTDLVNWTAHGFIFPSGHRPAWAASDFWAPEIHRVGAGYVAYFSARAAADGHLSIGAASAPTALGPFTDIGHPLVHDAAMGLIDASEFVALDGTPYAMWKVDGNATGAPTPIRVQRLAPDGLSVTGPIATIATNDHGWEGHVTEGPWMIVHGGMYYLFYSGNAFNTVSYALGVARGSSLTALFDKPAGPIVTSNGAWSGPGHGSVVLGPGGEDVFVYHAWIAGRVGDPNPREVLTDRLAWGADGWPTMLQAPSIRSQPLP